MHDDDLFDPETEQQPRPWIVLKTTYDIEAWIEQANRRLQRLLADAPPRSTGQGICFALVHGGEIHTHSSPEGELWLDVSEEAAWVKPVVAAVAGGDMPPGAIWRLPGEALTELLYGLNSLIETARIVLQHDFRIKKRY
ncbi:MAG: hypothetical protein JO002_17915 [Burkholderiaceae bacterium]|nr:hypothetical protein [Burkholderiaceae bacterium]